MNRDDRLFAIIGGSVVTAAATGFLLFAGGIAGTIENQPRVRVAPISIAEETPVSEASESDVVEAVPEIPADVVRASHETPRDLGAEAVRALVSGISSHPEWMSWLVTDDLLIRFVAAVEAVADGYSPSAELGFLATGGPFLVREDEGLLVIAAGSFRRYNLAVEVVSSVDTDDAVAIFRELEPAIEAARLDVAYHRGDFEDRLRQAVDHLLEVEIPTGPIEVERRTVTYAYADDEFEHLSDAQRQLIRMGRANALAVQEKLENLRSAFGWPEPAPPLEIRRAVTEPGPAGAGEPVKVAEIGVGVPDPEEALTSPLLKTPVEPMLTPFDPRVTGHSASWPVVSEEKISSVAPPHP